jgi:hypothetical protein
VFLCFTPILNFVYTAIVEERQVGGSITRGDRGEGGMSRRTHSRRGLRTH